MSSSRRASETQEVGYGVGDCRPKALQCLASPKAFTLNLGILILLQVCIYIYHFGMLRTLEKRFSLSSQQSGALMSTGDAVQVVFVITIGYFARNTHKPRYLSVSMVFLGVGCFLYAVPYFLYGPKASILGQSGTGLNMTSPAENMVCRTARVQNAVTCQDGKSLLVERMETAYIVFMVGSVLIGAGGSGVTVMGLSYIDDNVQNEKSAMYMGFATAMFPLGPVVGATVAALASSLPENLQDSPLRSSDPGFIGAWWLGYAVFPGLVILFSLPLFCYPKHLPEYYRQQAHHSAALKQEPQQAHHSAALKQEAQQAHRSAALKQEAQQAHHSAALKQEAQQAHHSAALKQEAQQAHHSAALKQDTPTDDTGTAHSTSSAVCRNFKDFPKTLMRLMSKPAFVTNTISYIFITYLIVNFGLNARYIEIFFLQSAFTANIITATCSALASVIGNLLGGAIMTRLRIGLQGAALMYWVTTVISVVCVTALMLVTCPQVRLAGQVNHRGQIDVDLPCSSDCACSRDVYLPVCGETSGSEMRTFLSPCHAGCQSHNGSYTFTNCSCLTSRERQTTNGPCQPPCSNIYIYAAIMFALSLVASIGTVPSTILTLRTVDPDLKSFALGIVSFLVNLLAFIPGPMIYGALADSSCLVWSETCNKTGNCLFYDINKYRFAKYGITLAFMGASLLFSILTWYLLRRDARMCPDTQQELTEAADHDRVTDDKEQLGLNNNIISISHL